MSTINRSSREIRARFARIARYSPLRRPSPDSRTYLTAIGILLMILAIIVVGTVTINLLSDVMAPYSEQATELSQPIVSY